MQVCFFLSIMKHGSLLFTNYADPSVVVFLVQCQTNTDVSNNYSIYQIPIISGLIIVS